MTASAEPTGPLAGLTILDLTRLLPGAFATALLADLGADVVKVEQPGTGDPMRAYEPRIGNASAFTWVTDRNKRSVGLNLRDATGRDAVLRLAETADALVESFRPGVMDRFGLGYDAVSAVNPRLVYCSISGCGADGPRALEAGRDINCIGRAGRYRHRRRAASASCSTAASRAMPPTRAPTAGTSSSAPWSRRSGASCAGAWAGATCSAPGSTRTPA